MKKLLFIPLLVLFAAVALGQPTVVPTCNNFDVNGVPIYKDPVTLATTTPCTDYFGAGNWANSPIPAGTIAGFTLVAGGSGYANPVVVVTDTTGATFNFSLATTDVTGGVVTSFTGGTGGVGYTMPQVTIVDVGTGGTLALPTCGGASQPACGSGAMATAVIGPPYSGGMLKFQAADHLVDLKSLIATADTTTFPNSDYYEIALVQYTQRMHSSLPPTTLRGYVQVPSGSLGCPVSPAPSYLGPVILAQKNRAVRVKFTNCLPTGTGGDLFIPTDTTFMGAGMGPGGASYTENRATLHLHGGATPWISDGTPHQWTVPVGETTTMQKGLSVAYVPDMWFDGTGAVIPGCAGQSSCAVSGATTNPGQGSLTFYWTNQQGGRLMFYHDHAYGITRLNVYAGEAAGYLLYDPAEEAGLAAATAPGSITAGDLTHLIPLVIQDKTFVPSAAQVGVQDPTWSANFGTHPPSPNLGDLWFPHVYIPNQNPADTVGGANGFGRWDYGAWFFPPQTSLTAAVPPTAVTIPCTSAVFPGQILAPTTACPTCGCPITPDPSGTPESFMDTPVVNGVAYPVLHVAPAAYRFRILAAGNDRSWNLSWFVADSTQGNTEVAMLPAAPPAKGAALPLCTAINPLAVPQLGIGLASALLDNSGNPLNGTGLPLNCWPNYGPLQGIPAPQTMWAADGRAGGAPDPTKAGPPWIQIGSEGGLLPAPVVIPATPVNFEQNTRSITIGSVAVHGLWLGPAERADVIVDFSQFAGKTLIMYNDAPTPAPAFDSRLDYFTDDGDQTPIGGAPNTPAGYGPNTRTIMQVVVDGTAPNAIPFSLSTLKAAFASTATTQGLFASTQPTTIVPEAAYNSAYNKTFSNTYAAISATNLTFTPIAPPLKFATYGYTSCGTVTSPVQCAELAPKAIQELFTLDYGRMNATLGTEVPLTNFQTQTTVPLGYVDWPTEIIKQGDTQLWKITHNGVDSHFVHFHLFNVQVVNRVGWDGSLRQPDQNEMGWKDTVRMNPLEDILVALQPITPTFPFPLPDSIRPNDVTAPTGPDPAISGLDPLTGNATVTTSNAPVNFGWEYVWHCHILGHEENDMMRPIIFQVAPPAPTSLAAVGPLSLPFAVILTWTDNSASETSFTVQRDTVPTFNSGAQTSWTVTSANGFSTPGFGQTITIQDTNVTAGNTYFYQVKADDNFLPANPNPAPFLAAPLSSAWSNIASVNAAPLTPTVTFTGAPASAAYNATFIVTATTNSSSVPTISGTLGVCSVGAVGGTAASATATVTMTSGTGVCTLTANWAADTFFTTASATQTTNAALAVPAVTFTGAPASAVYLSTFTVTATTNAAVAPTITGNAVCSAGAVLGTSPATALITMNSGTGTCTLTASWPQTPPAPNSNYAAASLTQNTAATLAAPVITWANPAAITYGTPLSATQLNASAAYLTVNPVPGSFVYTPPAGTVLNAGNQTLSVTFTPSVPANFSSATATVTLVVNRFQPLTITALTTTMTYGGAVPLITPIYTGFVNGDTALTAFSTQPTCSTTATSASLVSPPTYPSSCSGAVAANYTIAYVAGAVTVNKATSTTTITSNLPNPSIRGQIVTFSFSVVPQFTGVPSGSVQVSASTGETCSGALTGGAGSCTLTFLAGGSRSVTAVYSGDANFLVSTSAAVTQQVSSVDLSTRALLFGNQLLNTTSASQAVTLTNVGTTPLSMTSIATSAPFAQTNNCPLGGTLAAGRSCRINVTFRPTTLGVAAGTLTITDVDPTSPQLVSLTGTGVQPAAVLSPTSYNFGTIARKASATFGFTLSNPGTAPLTIAGISTGGSNRFSQTNNCGGSLAIGATCTINVTFSSNQVGTFNGTLNVSDNAPGSPQSATLTGVAQ
jgi:FtsP/CotA-like multicopper oxidase with cupredoxin domain